MLQVRAFDPRARVSYHLDGFANTYYFRLSTNQAGTGGLCIGAFPPMDGSSICKCCACSGACLYSTISDCLKYLRASIHQSAKTSHHIGGDAVRVPVLERARTIFVGKILCQLPIRWIVAVRCKIANLGKHIPSSMSTRLR